MRDRLLGSWSRRSQYGVADSPRRRGPRRRVLIVVERTVDAESEQMVISFIPSSRGQRYEKEKVFSGQEG